MSVAIFAMLLGLGVMLLGAVIVAVRPYDGKARRELDPKGFRSIWNVLRLKGNEKPPC